MLMKPSLGTPINRAHPLGRGLVGCWLINEGSGSKIYDLSGNGNTGILTNGPLWVPGRSGQALSFDGTDDYVDAGNPSSLQITGSMTASVWVKMTNVTLGNTFISKSTSDADEAYGFNMSSSKVYMRVQGPGLVESNRPGLTTLLNNQWYHNIFVYDQSVPMTHIYLNGKIDSGTVSGTIPSSLSNTSASVLIGANRGGAVNLFNGLIDDVRIYNRALSPQEVQQLYLNPYAMFEQYPVWRDYVAAAVGNRRRRLLLTRRAA